MRRSANGSIRVAREPRRSGALAWLLTIAVTGAIVWVMIDRWSELPNGVNLSAGFLIGLSLTTLVAFVLNGAVFRAMSEHFGSPLSLKEMVLLGFVNTTLNYMPLKTGLAVNGVIMRDRYRLRFAHWAVLLGGSNLLQLWLWISVAGALLVAGGTTTLLAWGLALAPTLGLAGLMWWGMTHQSTRERESGPRVWRALLAATDGMRQILGQPRLVAEVVLVNAGLLIVSALRFYWCFRMLGIDVSITDTVVLSAVSTVTQRFGILPGGLGFREAGVAAGAAAIGMKAATGLAAAVIDRLVLTFWIGVIGLPVTLWVIHDTKRIVAGRPPEGASPESIERS